MITLCCNDVVNEKFGWYPLQLYINRPSLRVFFCLFASNVSRFFFSVRCFSFACYLLFSLSPFLIFTFFSLFSFDSGDKKVRHEDSSVTFFPGKIRVVLWEDYYYRAPWRQKASHKDLSGKIRVVFPLYFHSSIFYFNVYFILYVNS